MRCPKHIGKWLLIACILLGFWGSLIGQNQEWEKINHALENADISDAVRRLERLADKGSNPARERLGEINWKIKQYETAAYWYAKAVNHEPVQHITYFQYALVLQTLGKFESAYPWFKKYHQVAPQDPKGKGFLDICLQQIENPPDSGNYQIELLPLNSAYPDFSFYPFEQGFLFSSERENSIAGYQHYSSTSQTPLSEIYYVEEVDSGKWNRPISFSWPGRARFQKGAIAIAPDSATLFFTRSFRKGRKEPPVMEILRTTLEGGKWREPEKVLSEWDGANVGYPAISPDGKTLYFASDRKGGAGGWDLYQYNLASGEAGPAENLGTNINTSGDELFPFVDGNGTLHFSSNGHPGYGGLDLFYSVQANGGWRMPVHAEIPLNSSGDDFSIYLDVENNQGFLASNRDTRSRNTDIYRFISGEEVLDCPVQKELVLCYRIKEENYQEELPYQLIYEWDLGDRTRERALSLRHCYESPGIYEINLSVIDSLTGKTMFVASEYVLEVKSEEQPYIHCPDTVKLFEKVTFDARKSNLPEFSIQAYQWDFGDGSKAENIETIHTYYEAGTYPVKLIVSGYDASTGLLSKVCVSKEVMVVPRATATRVAPGLATRLPNLDTSYHVSAIPSPDYRIQLGTSLAPIPTDPGFFKGLEKVSSYWDSKVFRYLYGKYTQRDSAFKMYRNVQEMGFPDASVLTFSEDTLLDKESFQESWLPGTDLPFAYVRGKVITASSGPLPEGTKLVWKNLTTGEIFKESLIASENGEYRAELPLGSVYEYQVEAEGYFPSVYTLNLDQYSGHSVIYDTLKLHTLPELLEIGKPITLKNVFFVTGKHELKPESRPELLWILKILNENPLLNVEITGHTDNVGKAADNLILSRKRAAAVAQFLTLKGVPVEKISHRGFGEEKPTASNETPAGRKQNRRVELIFLIGSQP